jgi:hypothetical protein
MLTLFENIIQELTDTEKDRLAPMLIDILKRTTANNRFTGRRIIEYFTAQGYPISQIRLCKLVQYIRVANLVAPLALIGSGSGYFLTDDPELVGDQIESLEGRINSMRSSLDSLKAQKLNLERGNQSGRITEKETQMVTETEPKRNPPLSGGTNEKESPE